MNYKLRVCLILTVLLLTNLSFWITAVILASRPLPIAMCDSSNAIVQNAQKHEQVFQNGTKTGVVFVRLAYLILDNDLTTWKNTTDLLTASKFSLFKRAKNQAIIFIYIDCNIRGGSRKSYYLAPIQKIYSSLWIPGAVFSGLTLVILVLVFCIFCYVNTSSRKVETVAEPVLEFTINEV